MVRLRISACASSARVETSLPSSLPSRGWTPRPGTLIVYAPMALATMPIPSCIISAGLSRAAQSGSEVCIMFPGREEKGVKRKCPQKRCVDDVDVRTGSIGSSNAIARRIDLMHVLQLSCRTPLEPRRTWCQRPDTARSASDRLSRLSGLDKK